MHIQNNGKTIDKGTLKLVTCCTCAASQPIKMKMYGRESSHTPMGRLHFYLCSMVLSRKRESTWNVYIFNICINILITQDCMLISLSVPKDLCVYTSFIVDGLQIHFLLLHLKNMASSDLG